MTEQSAVQALQAKLRGQLIQAGDADYELARKVYNAMIDRHPRMIVRCAGIADVSECVNYARDNDLRVAVRSGGRYHDSLKPHGAGGAYVNFLMDEGQERVRATYGDNYERLSRIKRRFDPDNLFRVNQNIRPSA